MAETGSPNPRSRAASPDGRGLSAGPRLPGVASLVVVLLTAVFSVACRADDGRVGTGSPVRLGLGGVVRMGHWAPVQVQIADESVAGRVRSLVVTCPDDERSPVEWRQPATAVPIAGDAEHGQWLVSGLFRLGSPSGQVRAGLLDEAGQLLSEWSFDLRRDASQIQVLDGTANLILAAGLSADFCARLPQQDGRGHPIRIIRTETPWELPEQARGYDAVRWVVLGGMGSRFPDQLDDRRQAALKDWVETGGRIMVVESPGAAVADWLAGLRPGGAAPMRSLAECRRLEFFAQATEQLALSPSRPLVVAGLQPAPDAVLVVEEDRVPLLVQSARGLGQVVWSTVNLDDSPFPQWPSLPRVLVQLLVAGAGGQAVGAAGQVQSRSLQYGFDDLSGQLRMALEEFRTVRPVNITTVALLAVIGVLLFSFGDWLLLRHVLGNRALTWVTFPLMAAALGGTALLIAGYSRPGEVRYNMLELLDIDAASGNCRVTGWCCLWTPEAGRPALSFEPPDALEGEWNWNSFSWQGQPGSGLAGMSRPASLRTVGGSLDIMQMRDSGNGKVFEPAQAVFAPSSARSFIGELSGRLRPLSGPGLRFNPQLKRLEGTVSNPLPVRLRQPRIHHGNDVYVVPRDLAPGESVSIAETLERTARTVLNRREVLEVDKRKDITAVTRWIVADTDLERIAQMIGFHELAGGSGYTTLSHDYHDRLEGSELVQLRRAVLTGTLDRPLAGIRQNGTLLGPEQADRQLGVLRVVLPVVSPESGDRNQQQ